MKGGRGSCCGLSFGSGRGAAAEWGRGGYGSATAATMQKGWSDWQSWCCEGETRWWEPRGAEGERLRESMSRVGGKRAKENIRQCRKRRVRAGGDRLDMRRRSAS